MSENGSGLSVAAVAGRWLALYIPTARSAKNVSMAAQRVDDYLLPFMGERSVLGLGADDLRGYRLWLQERGLSPRSVRHLLADVRCLLNWCVESGILRLSPFPRRVMPRIQETPPDRLSPAEVLAVLGIPDPQAFVVRLGLGTGLRWGELIRLESRHLEGGMLVISQTKSARVRRVPVSPALAAEIAGAQGRLVPYTDRSTSSFNRFVQRHSGVARFHVHQLRHTFACRWVEGGGSLPSLQQILGHASVVTTQHYARLSDESVRLEAARINGSQAGW